MKLFNEHKFNYIFGLYNSIPLVFTTGKKCPVHHSSSPTMTLFKTKYVHEKILINKDMQHIIKHGESAPKSRNNCYLGKEIVL